MHNAAFRALGLDAVYLAFDVAPDGLADALAGARALGVRQLAVSIPHKVEVLTHADHVDATARRIGAANTLTLREGRWLATNTDWIGALRALELQAGVELAGARVVVLGAGGTARAVVYGLLEREAHVTVLNRTRRRAEHLAELLGGGEVAAGSLDELAQVPHDVLVQTTSVGLGEDRSPVDREALVSGSVVLDAVYAPERTRLLRDAEQRGARTVGGKWMLIHQAAEQLRLWTGREAPIEVMAQAFDAA